ncbi:hypothetical protein [Alteromonas oceanisediminis]|uniref:hypothetical protein n=1 Tax=Alteromonas oceanisediminis TaxID=2836180 RepID=UPI001BDAC226|nr:hypothetical protein [Alteromonas oceanisediminis]MBT0587084.1 hypothetical protein [Alteromonas oceanisediminis]
MRILSNDELGGEVSFLKQRLNLIPDWKASEKLSLELRLKQLSGYINGGNRQQIPNGLVEES